MVREGYTLPTGLSSHYEIVDRQGEFVLPALPKRDGKDTVSVSCRVKRGPGEPGGPQVLLKVTTNAKWRTGGGGAHHGNAGQMLTEWVTEQALKYGAS